MTNTQVPHSYQEMSTLFYINIRAFYKKKVFKMVKLLKVLLNVLTHSLAQVIRNRNSITKEALLTINSVYQRQNSF